MYLETKRLILRKIQETDFTEFVEFAADEEACRMMGRDLITDAASARPTFDWLLNREDRAYVLQLKETGKVIGNLTVYNSVPEYLCHLEALHGKNDRSLSFSISRAYRRQGLMQEAVTAVLDQLFWDEGADCVLYGFFAFNEPSAKLQHKLGFQPLYQEIISMDGEEILCLQNILWRSDWIQKQNP